MRLSEEYLEGKRHKDARRLLIVSERKTREDRL